MNHTNFYRALRFGRALNAYDSDTELRGCLVDLLTDARHWCDQAGVDFAGLDRIACDHHRHEVGEKCA